MAADSGMTQQQGEEATGGIFALVKKNLSEEQYNQIVSKIPQIDGLVNKEEETSKDRAAGGGAGGLMSSLAGMAGGSGGASTGGGGGNTAALTTLIGICGKYGISAKQVNAFLPQVVSLVKKQCGVDVGSMLGLPASGSSSSGTGGSQATGDSNAMSGMMNSAMGMFGKK